jgi:lipopolysaccharide export LptBFGC system permease protein LptF
MALLAIPFSIQNQRHSSLARDLSICFLFIIVYWLIYSTALSLGKSGALQPVIATWLPNLIFFSLGYFLVKRGKKI